MPRNDDYRASGQRAASQGSSPDCCPADLNCDGVVNGADLGILLGDWGQEGVPGDITGDGPVNGADLGILLAAWDTYSEIADLDGDGIVDGRDLGLMLADWSD